MNRQGRVLHTGGLSAMLAVPHVAAPRRHVLRMSPIPRGPEVEPPQPTVCGLLPSMSTNSLFSGPFGGGTVPADDVDDKFPSMLNRDRRTSVSAESMMTTPSEIKETECHPKTKDQSERLYASLGDNVIFRQLESEQKEDVISAMREWPVKKGDIVIKQGDDGDYCYFIETGSLDVFIQPPGTPAHEALAAPSDQLGQKVLSYGPGALFGELALLYLQPRAASVVATSDCTLWALDRVTFRSILAHSDRKRRLMLDSFLRQVPLLQSLRDDERARVSDAIDVVEYNTGDVIIREGDIGTKFYMVVNGVAEVIKAGDEAHPVSMLQRGDYFGELALLHRAPRAATVVASKHSPLSKLRVAVLEEDAFTRLLGPLKDIMNRHAETHYGTTTSTMHSASSDSSQPPGSPKSKAH